MDLLLYIGAEVLKPASQALLRRGRGKSGPYGRNNLLYTLVLHYTTLFLFDLRGKSDAST